MPCRATTRLPAMIATSMASEGIEPVSRWCVIQAPFPGSKARRSCRPVRTKSATVVAMPAAAARALTSPDQVSAAETAVAPQKSSISAIERGQ